MEDSKTTIDIANQPLRLHIGGKVSHPEWKILDVEPRPEVDFIGDAADLREFEDASIEAIYGSHVLEHFFYGLNYELAFVLAEWYRVLKPQGKLMLSVPDLRTLCWLYNFPEITVQERFSIMRMMFGGHMNEYDVHKVGFDVDILALYLQEAGFSSIERVNSFDLFQDCSSLVFMGYPISLNVIAHKA